MNWVEGGVEGFMAKSWGQIGREVTAQLQGLDDERAIAELGEETLELIKELEPDEDKYQSRVSLISREIRKVFPRSEEELPLYFYDPNGQTHQPRWRHLIFQALSFRPDVEEREEEGFDDETREVLDALELNDETEELLTQLIDYTGDGAFDLIEKAIVMYSKSILNKVACSDLATVLTEDLLYDRTYSTTPGRAEELTKRAIMAIKRHNQEVATEYSQRWAITQSAISRMTGSKAHSIKEALKPYQLEIDDHNAQYGLNNYTNRGRELPIQDAINFVTLVPDGLGF